VWVSSSGEGAIRRIEPRAARVTRRWTVGAAPVWLDATPNAVWVPVLGSGSVVRIDPHSNQIVGRPIRVGGGPGRALEVDGIVWVTDFHGRTVTRIRPG
jgi:DNA-binding beta-propeller fold protein YncE